MEKWISVSAFTKGNAYQLFGRKRDGFAHDTPFVCVCLCDNWKKFSLHEQNKYISREQKPPVLDNLTV